MTWSRRFQQFGLSSRIAALSLGLLLLVQAAVFSVVQLSIDRNARRQIAQELIVGERVWRRLLDQNAQKLGQGASLLAADYGFRSSVSTGDIDTTTAHASVPHSRRCWIPSSHFRRWAKGRIVRHWNLS